LDTDASFGFFEEDTVEEIATLKGNDNVKVKVFYLILPQVMMLSTVTLHCKYGCSINYHQI
jgi:hypothetical protein